MFKWNKNAVGIWLSPFKSRHGYYTLIRSEKRKYREEQMLSSSLGIGWKSKMDRRTSTLDRHASGASPHSPQNQIWKKIRLRKENEGITKWTGRTRVQSADFWSRSLSFFFSFKVSQCGRFGRRDIGTLAALRIDVFPVPCPCCLRWLSHRKQIVLKCPHSVVHCLSQLFT